MTNPSDLDKAVLALARKHGTLRVLMSLAKAQDSFVALWQGAADNPDLRVGDNRVARAKQTQAIVWDAARTLQHKEQR